MSVSICKLVKILSIQYLKLLGIIWALYSGSFIFSQQFSSNQKFVHYTTSEGLSSRSQFNIVQDKEGFIWIGTSDGLNRFDGYEFKVYRNIPGDTTSIGSNETSVFIDSYGTLWINTYSGLYWYNRDHDNFSVFKTNKGEIIYSTTCFTEDKFRRIWIGTHNGLFLYDPVKRFFIKTFISNHNNINNTIASSQIRSLYTDGETIWIGYSSGMFSEVNAKTLRFSHYKLPLNKNENITDNFINSLCVSGDSLWISTWGKGVWIFNKSSHTSIPFSELKSAFVNTLCKDRNNNIWIGTDNDGLVYYNNEKKNTTFYVHNNNNANSLSNNCISNIFIDLQNNLWLCSKDGDVNYLCFDNSFRFRFCNPTDNNELSKKNITSLLETEDQNLWIGFQFGGLDIFSLKNKSKRFINGHNLGQNTVLTIYKDRSNDIWLGTYKGGLKKYNKASGDFITFLNNPMDSSSLSGNDIRKIAEDSKGYLWIAIQGGGLNRFNKQTGKVKRFQVNYQNFSTSPITSDWLVSLLCDKNDNIWTGSGAGATFLSNDLQKSLHFNNIPNDTNSLSNNFVNVIFEDSEGNIWLGTNNGLNLYNPKKNNFTIYSTQNGLCNNFILSLVEDNNKNLWIGTNKGLSVLSIKSRKFKNYTKDNGLYTDEFNIGASCKNSRGELYFGGIDGLVIFNPANITTNNFVPPVYITDFTLFNQSVSNNYKNKDFSLEKPINQCKEIVLKHSQNIFGFKFVALNYLNQQKNMYSYKLEGFDKTWSVPGEKREVTYTNLNHGSYTFRVKACNNDGVWNEKGASLKVIIKPPFWKTYWAKLFYLVFITFLLFLFRYLILRDANYKRKLELEKLEIEKLQEMDAQKMRFFSNISHEFRTPLTLIVGPLDKLVRTVKEESYIADLQIIQRNAKRLLRLINQLMDFRKIEVAGLEVNYSKADIVKFVSDLANVFLYEATQRKINFTINTSIKELPIYFDRDKLDKILYNLLSNAFKYTSENGNISISFGASDKKLSIAVEDNGCGIPFNDQAKIFQRFYQVEGTSNTGTGIGLALTKELVQLLGGTIGVESEPGKGSKFVVVIPLIESMGGSQQKDDFSKEEVIPDSSDNNDVKIETQFVAEKELPILLIVEDNADMRQYIRGEFNETHRIIEAVEGNAGFEKAIAEIPDLIISDIMMPGMDGVEFCEKIKTDERTSHIPIILLTALSSDEHAIAGLKCGADDYIIKPFNTAILKLKVRNIIESRKLLQSKFIKEPSASIKEIALSAIEERFLKRAYEVVEENLSNADLEGSNFAEALGMSRAQVYRKISALTGQSVKEFIRIIRLKKAQELLLNGNKNISEIAFTVGFNSAAYFTRSFTEYYGVPPTRFTGSKEL